MHLVDREAFFPKKNGANALIATLNQHPKIAPWRMDDVWTEKHFFMEFMSNG
jgi:hypothetical protein